MTLLNYRFATINDADLYYQWANDPLVRQNSFNQDAIPYVNHVNWFTKKLQSDSCYFYLFLNIDNEPVGQVRIDKDENETIIGLSIDEKFRGMSLGATMLKMACDDYLQHHAHETIVAYIKEDNIPSYKIFEKAGFGNPSKIRYADTETFRLIKQLP